MKAALVTATGQVGVQDVAEPNMKDDEVLIKVKTVGVCGSDLHLFEGTHAFRKPPAVLGHEIAGEIVKIGKNVSKFAVGDRVTVEPQLGCDNCEMCAQELVNLCYNKSVPGTPAWTGTFVEYFNAPERTLYKLADSVSYEEGTLVEPLAVAVHAFSRAQIPTKDSVVIFGVGTIGMLCVVVARELGFKNIICTDTAPYNRKMALELGANVVLDPLKDDVVAKVMELTANKGADLALDCAGADGILTQASECVRKRGEIGIVAMNTKHSPFYCYTMVFKEQTMFGVMTYETCDFVKAAEMINEGLDLKMCVTQNLPLAQTQEALSILSEKKENVIKIIVTM